MHLIKTTDGIRLGDAYVSRGNRKMSRLLWALPALQTCHWSTPECRDNCYARKAERAYPDCLPCRQRNWRAAESPDFVDVMVTIIRAQRRRRFRIHESGDFYSQAYVDKWISIAKALPSVRFLAFTKAFALDFSRRPPNFTVIWSVWPDTIAQVPTGPRAYAGDCAPRGAVECHGKCDACGACWHADANFKVHFKIH